MRRGAPRSAAEPILLLFMNRPIRKRAFWRALKRGELWAVVPYDHMKSGGVCLTQGPNKFARVLPDINCPSDTMYIMWPMKDLL